MTHTLSVQVGMASFLNFRLDVSAANQYALPMLVAHNAKFDNNMLLRNCWQAGLHVPGSWRSLCTLKVAKALARTETNFQLPDKKLSTLARHFGYVGKAL